MSICLPDGRCIDPSSMKVSELKDILKKNKVDISQVVEKVLFSCSICASLMDKSELVDLVYKHPPKAQGKKTIHIDIVSDTMCPYSYCHYSLFVPRDYSFFRWCYVGRKNLEKSLKEFPDVSFESSDGLPLLLTQILVNWLPFFLNPNIPDEGMGFRDYVSRVYGSTSYLDRAQEHLRLKGSVYHVYLSFLFLRREAGINFLFKEDAKVFPTIDSHRLVKVLILCYIASMLNSVSGASDLDMKRKIKSCLPCSSLTLSKVPRPSVLSICQFVRKGFE